MSKKITHKYFDEDYWMTPHVKSGYHPQDGYNQGEYAPQATAEFLMKLYGGIRNNGKGEYWLEAGCAFGWVVEQLINLGVYATGFDISKYAIKVSKKQGGNISHSVSRTDGLDTSFFADGYYDLIYSIETAEHIHQDDIEKWLGNLYYWLKPGGKLFMTICVGNNNLRGLDDIDESHQTLQPRIWWEDLLEKVGFVKDEERYNKALFVSLEHKEFSEPINIRDYFDWNIFTWEKLS